jgi:hypothetical protein
MKSMPISQAISFFLPPRGDFRKRFTAKDLTLLQGLAIMIRSCSPGLFLCVVQELFSTIPRPFRWSGL